MVSLVRKNWAIFVKYFTFSMTFNVFFNWKWCLVDTKNALFCIKKHFQPKIVSFGLWKYAFLSIFIEIDILQLKFGLFANQLLFWFCFVGALGVSLSKVAVRPNELWVGYRTYRLVPDQISISTQSNLYTSNLSLFNSIRICPCPYMKTGRRGLEGNLISRT